MPEDQQGGTPGNQQGNQQGGQQGQSSGEPGGTPANWDAVLESLPAGVKALYENHVGGLKNAVQATRQERDALSGKLSEITKALGKDPSEAKKLLDEMTTEVEQANRRATFVQEAVRPEVGCTNPKLAFIVASTEKLFDSRGNADWESIKRAAPELFQKPQAGPGRADGGAGNTQQHQVSMNDYIRRAAGR